MPTEAERRAMQAGYGRTGDIGGQPKQTYYTPDGREVRAMPDMHEYVITHKREDKRFTGGFELTQTTGLRDANLDKWLASPPANPLPHCPHCDTWHKTIAEVDACGERIKTLTKKALKEAPVDKEDRLTKLESDMADIKDMFKKLLEKM
jgi:hypothetical protein